VQSKDQIAKKRVRLNNLRNQKKEKLIRSQTIGVLFAVKSIIIKQRTFIYRNTFRKKYGRQRERKSDLIETNGRRGSGRKKTAKKIAK